MHAKTAYHTHVKTNFRIEIAW